MISEKEIEEIKEHLERSQNPIFYYDNDADGLCSFLLLRRFLGRGKGVAIRSYPDLNKTYAKKAVELKADYVFILDKPVISREFVSAISEMGLPLVWIDHHSIEQDWKEEEFEQLRHYNSYDEERGAGEPVTFVCYEVDGRRKEDLWIAMMGCIADHFMPDFASEFGERYGNFWGKEIRGPFEAYFGTEIGKIAQSLNFGLKDSTTHIVQMQNYLINCKGPEEVFIEVNENSAFRHKYGEIRRKYDALLERAEKNVEDKMIYFEYSGELSISSDISNELSYKYPDKVVVVVYKKGTMANISMRGKGIRRILNKIIKFFDNASGGGHEDAVGARIKAEDIAKFKKVLEGELI